MKDKWLYEKFIAHRGLHGGKIKQNTIEAFKKAIENGYNIELDVQLTKDRIPVVFHDLFLDNLTDGRGNVRDLIFNEVREVRYKDSHAAIPPFEEVLELCEGKTGIMVEIKKLSLEDESTEIEDAILPMLKAYRGDFVVKSFNPYSVDYFRQKAPGFTRGFLSDALTIEDYPENVRPLVKELVSETEKKVDFIDFNAGLLEKSDFYKSIAKISTIAWTIRSQKAYDRIKDKVDNIIFEGFIPMRG